jgi:pyruvate/oxaloacetate carboxyltransferase
MELAIEAVARHRGDLRGGDLLYRRHPRPDADEVLAAVLRADGEAAGRDGHARARHQGHGGLCKPYAAYALVKALREEVGVPIHFHTHDTSGVNAGSVLRAADAGVDIADAALASMSGMTSQPSLNGIVAALRNTERDTGSIRRRSTISAATGRRCASRTTRSRKG